MAPTTTARPFFACFLRLSSTAIKWSDLRIRRARPSAWSPLCPIPLAGKGILAIELLLVTPDSWQRVDSWWSDLFGVPTAMLWRETVTVSLHAGLGDYPGAFVAERHGRIHLSLPDWVTAAHVRELESLEPSLLASRTFWEEWTPTSSMVALGPAVHAFTDREPEVAADGQEDVVLLTVDDLDALRDRVDDEDWEESGFAHADGLVHA